MIQSSVRRSDWERRWDRTQPQAWKGSRIAVEGDAEWPRWKLILASLAVAGAIAIICALYAVLGG